MYFMTGTFFIVTDVLFDLSKSAGFAGSVEEMLLQEAFKSEGLDGARFYGH